MVNLLFPLIFDSFLIFFLEVGVGLHIAEDPSACHDFPARLRVHRGKIEAGILSFLLFPLVFETTELMVFVRLFCFFVFAFFSAIKLNHNLFNQKFG